MAKKKNYNELTKEEKKKTKEKFYKTEYGKVTKNRLNRLFIYGILGFIVSLYLLLTENTLSYLFIAYILLFVSAIYFVASFILRRKELQNFLNK